MPGSLLTADTNFPDLEKKGSTEEKLKSISGYLYMLLEQLRYTLANLGQDNFNDTELDNIGKLLTGPLTVRVEEAEKGVAQISITVDGITDMVKGLDGKYSKVEQNVNGLTSTVQGLESGFSQVKQTVDGLEVTTAGGTSVIAGDHIKSGTIEGAVLKVIMQGVQAFAASGLQCSCWLPSIGNYADIGGIWFDYYDGKYRMFVGSDYTAVAGGDFALKLQSVPDSSYESKEGSIYLTAAKQMILKAAEQVRIAAPGGGQYQFRDDGIWYGGRKIVDNTKAV